MDLHIVSVSGGAPSALCAVLAVARYGAENVRLVFADTLAEHSDNYRFLVDLEFYTGVQIIRLVDGRTPLEVGRDEHYVPTQAFATCTHRLKIELIVNYAARFSSVVMHIGYDLSDMSRVPETFAAWASRGVRAVVPIIEAKILDVKSELRLLGFQLPVTYSQGFKHANCLGAGGCVKFGQSDMLRVLQLYPDGYALREKWEIEMIITRWLPYALMAFWLGCSEYDLGYQPYTFLRDNAGVFDDFLTLRRFRHNYESVKLSSKQLRLFEFDADLSGCSVECGVSNPDKL